MLHRIAEPAPIFVLLWAIILLLSWTGLGSLLCRVVHSRRHHQADFGLRAAWGVAFSISVGGVLNLSGLVSSSIIVALVIAGAALWLIDAIIFLLDFIKQKRWKQAPLTLSHFIYSSMIALICGLALLILLLLVLHPSRFNEHDDFHAYLVFPLQMLQASFLTHDPFNASRMGSLGGQSFLQLFALAVVPFTYIKIIDPGVCLIICSALIFGYQKQNQGRMWSTAISTLLPLLVLPAIPATNLSAHATSMALFVALYRTLDWIRFVNSRRVFPNSLIVALIAASTMSLKSTAVPFVAIMLAAYYLPWVYLSSDRKLPMYEAIFVGALTFVLLLPWMLMMHLSSGTYLYPYFGNGYSGTFYGTFPTYLHFTRSGDLFADPLLFPIIILALIYFYGFRTTITERVGTVSLVTAAVGGTLAIMWATAGNARYSIPFTAMTVIILISNLARRAERHAEQISQSETPAAARGAVRALAFIATIVTSALLIWQSKAAIQSVLRHRLFLVEHARVTNYNDRSNTIVTSQRSIPQKQLFIAKLFEPFLLDFSRNKIYVVDWAHGSSLPPGMPFRKGSDAVSEYLLSKSIRYVLYEYDKERVTSFMEGDGWYAGGDKRCRDLERAAPVLSRSGGESGEVAYECAMDLAMADFIQNLDQLMTTREAIFDDGKLIVLDLSMHR